MFGIKHLIIGVHWGTQFWPIPIFHNEKDLLIFPNMYSPMAHRQHNMSWILLRYDDLQWVPPWPPAQWVPRGHPGHPGCLLSEIPLFFGDQIFLSLKNGATQWRWVGIGTAETWKIKTVYNPCGLGHGKNSSLESATALGHRISLFRNGLSGCGSTATQQTTAIGIFGWLRARFPVCGSNLSLNPTLHEFWVMACHGILAGKVR